MTVSLPQQLTLPQGINMFTPQSLNIANPGLQQWITGGVSGQIPLSVWPAQPEVRGNERDLVVYDYPEFRRLYQFGDSISNPQTGQPQAVSVDVQDRLVVWPTPDQAYRLAGTYRRVPQELEGDQDLPIVNAAYHDAIVRYAIFMLHEHDEADSNMIILASNRADKKLDPLRRRYLTSNISLANHPIGPSGGAVGLAFRDGVQPPTA